jgi:RNA polymerase sigma-70 factor, ECF subfamily
MIDSDTLKRLREGNTHAFEQIVYSYQHEMLCVATRIIGQLADAEEVRQRVLIRIWQSREKLPKAASFEAWLRRCVVNESISHLRQRKRRDVLMSEFADSRRSNSSEPEDLDVDQVRKVSIATRNQPFSQGGTGGCDFLIAVWEVTRL